MSEPPLKRPRASTNGGAHPPSTVDFASLIKIFPAATTNMLLATAAQIYPDIAALINTEHNRLTIIERARIIDFDYLSKSAWRALNGTYNRMSGSDQYQSTGEALATVEGCIKTILRKCPIHANFGTKRNGLETLRKIGKSICLANDTIGREVQIHFQYSDLLEKTILEIVEGMTQFECDIVLNTADWAAKLQELASLGKDHSLFKGLRAVIMKMKGEGEEDESDESEDDLQDDLGDESEDESEDGSEDSD